MEGDGDHKGQNLREREQHQKKEVGGCGISKLVLGRREGRTKKPWLY